MGWKLVMKSIKILKRSETIPFQLISFLLSRLPSTRNLRRRGQGKEGEREDGGMRREGDFENAEEDPQYYDTKFEEAVGNVKGGRSVMSASFHRLRATDYHTNIATCHWLPHKHRHVQMSSLFARVGNDRLAPCGTEDNKVNCLSSEYRSTTAIEQNIVAWRFTSLTTENEFEKKCVCVWMSVFFHINVTLVFFDS